MENLSIRLVRRERSVQAQWSSISNAVSANSRPVGIGVVGSVGERKVGAEFGLGGGDGGAHPAVRGVDEDANRGGAIGGVGNGVAV